MACFVQPITAKELNKVDPKKACQYFDDCFTDPSAYTVAIVGKIDTEKALPLILQYLVSVILLAILSLFEPEILYAG